jgi:hypothetical protein
MKSAALTFKVYFAGLSMDSFSSKSIVSLSSEADSRPCNTFSKVPSSSKEFIEPDSSARP